MNIKRFLTVSDAIKRARARAAVFTCCCHYLFSSIVLLKYRVQSTLDSHANCVLKSESKPLPKWAPKVSLKLVPHAHMPRAMGRACEGGCVVCGREDSGCVCSCASVWVSRAWRACTCVECVCVWALNPPGLPPRGWPAWWAGTLATQGTRR